MNQEITVELQFFFISILWGSIILLFYDVLRIIRRLVKHGVIFLTIEDILFWIAASIFIYTMIYRQNNGIIRGFSIMGMTIGMLLYHYIVKDSFVNIITKIILTLLSPFLFVFKTVFRFVRSILLKGKNAVKFLIKQLKKLWKSVKITVNKRRQKAVEARQQKAAIKAAKKSNSKKAARKAAKKNDTKKAAGKSGKDRGFSEDKKAEKSSQLTSEPQNTRQEQGDNQAKNTAQLISAGHRTKLELRNATDDIRNRYRNSTNY
jgi:spore cortex biosynthesis protein YabQ